MKKSIFWTMTALCLLLSHQALAQGRIVLEAGREVYPSSATCTPQTAQGTNFPVRYVECDTDEKFYMRFHAPGNFTGTPLITNAYIGYFTPDTSTTNFCVKFAITCFATGVATSHLAIAKSATYTSSTGDLAGYGTANGFIQDTVATDIVPQYQDGSIAACGATDCAHKDCLLEVQRYSSGCAADPANKINIATVTLDYDVTP